MLALERKREQKWIDVSRPAAKRSADTMLTSSAIWRVLLTQASLCYVSSSVYAGTTAVSVNQSLIWSVHLCCYEIYCPCLVWLISLILVSAVCCFICWEQTIKRKWAFRLSFAFSLDLQNYFPPRSACSVLLTACHFVVSSQCSLCQLWIVRE